MVVVVEDEDKEHHRLRERRITVSVLLRALLFLLMLSLVPLTVQAANLREEDMLEVPVSSHFSPFSFFKLHRASDFTATLSPWQLVTQKCDDLLPGISVLATVTAVAQRRIVSKHADRLAVRSIASSSKNDDTLFFVERRKHDHLLSRRFQTCR